MTNRVLLGKRGTEYGLWVSKPGIDVTTAGIDDLLFSSSSSSTKYGQVLAQGSHTFSTTAGQTHSVNVTMPVGKEPFVYWYVSFSASQFTPFTNLMSDVDVSYTFSANTTTVNFYKYGLNTFTVYYIILSAELN
jgi:hypothetical protein